MVFVVLAEKQSSPHLFRILGSMHCLHCLVWTDWAGIKGRKVSDGQTLSPQSSPLCPLFELTMVAQFEGEDARWQRVAVGERSYRPPSGNPLVHQPSQCPPLVAHQAHAPLNWLHCCCCSSQRGAWGRTLSTGVTSGLTPPAFHTGCSGRPISMPSPFNHDRERERSESALKSLIVGLRWRQGGGEGVSRVQV